MLLICVSIDSEKNCRRMLKLGLSLFLDIAQFPYTTLSISEQKNMKAYGEYSETRLTATEALDVLNQNSAYATSLLQIIGRYNYFTCSNCSTQQYMGRTCVRCGRKLSRGNPTFS